jgi:transcription initiation factor TFIIB
MQCDSDNGDFCPNCGSCSSGFLEDPVRGDTICSECGVCLPEQMMMEAPDRRTFFGDLKSRDQHFRVDPFLALAGCSTIISDRTLNRLSRVAENRLQSGGESIAQRNLVNGFGHISSFGVMFELPKVVTDTAKHLLFEFSKRSAVPTIDSSDEKKGKRVNCGSESFVLSVCYLAMEKHLCGKPIREVAAVSGIEEENLRKCLRKLRKVIPDLLRSDERQSSDGISNIQAFIQSIVQQLQVGISVENLAVEIAQRAMADLYEELGGKRPSTIAAACVYLAGKQLNVEMDAEDIAVCAAVSKARMMTIASSIEANSPSIEANSPTIKE